MVEQSEYLQNRLPVLNHQIQFFATVPFHDISCFCSPFFPFLRFAISTVAQKGHTCKLKMLLETKNFTCKLKIVHVDPSQTRGTHAHPHNLVKLNAYTYRIYANHDQPSSNAQVMIDKSAHRIQEEACEEVTNRPRTYTHVMRHSCYQIDDGNEMCTKKYIFRYKQQNTIQPQDNEKMT